MATIWDELGIAEEKFGEWLADVKARATALGAKIAAVFSQEKAVTPEMAITLQTLFADVQALIPLLETATAGEGLNLPADSAGFKQLLTIVNDLKTLVPQVDAAYEDLKGLA